MKTLIHCSIVVGRGLLELTKYGTTKTVRIYNQRTDYGTNGREVSDED